MKTAADSTVNVSSRPEIIHRKTDPFPMRDFKCVVWACEETKEEEELSPTMSEENNMENEPFAIKKSILDDERFLVSGIIHVFSYLSKYSL